MCNHFFPVEGKDNHCLCVNCRGKECNTDDHCCNYHDWTDQMWSKVGLVFASHLGGASSILGHSIEGSEVCISGDRRSLSMWFGSHVKLLVLLLNNHWFHAT